ncbi:MAG: AMP-binding protein [Candidatus Elarobacter sp.]
MDPVPSISALLVGAAERFGAAPFLVDAASRREYGVAEVAATVARRAGALRARGVVRGDRVLIAGANSVDLVEAWLGVTYAGAIPAAVNPALTRPELEYLACDLQPRLAIVDPTLRAAHDALEARGVPVVGVADGADGAPGDAARADPGDVAGIVYTSGTTSRPKGALVRQAAYVGAGESMAAWLGLARDERLWCVLPLFHINAQAYSLMTALANGYALVVSPKFRASTFWRDAAELQVTEVNLTGAMLAILAQQPADRFVPGALRTIYAAPALSPDENHRFETRFGVRIVTGFGMSENTFGTIQSATSKAKLNSIGRPRSHPNGTIVNEMRVVSPDGDVLRAGEVGELQFRSAAVTPGYWNAPEVSARTIVDGWLRTGDAGYLDAEGDVMLVGRYKEMIRRRGENIAPREVEEVLMLHDGVENAAVIGVPSPLSEEDVVACVIRAAGSDVDEEGLRAWCAARLAPYKVPQRVVFREAFPLTATMRVAKVRLAAEIAPLAGAGAH